MWKRDRMGDKEKKRGGKDQAPWRGQVGKREHSTVSQVSVDGPGEKSPGPG